ncbi:hypothetical protein BLOT_008829 [Blomia tropicalis]|nr:hypothetical protein BLOT_008829 [Blomia tropicalis]
MLLIKTSSNNIGTTFSYDYRQFWVVNLVDSQMGGQHFDSFYGGMYQHIIRIFLNLSLDLIFHQS